MALGVAKTNLSQRMHDLAEKRDDLPGNWLELADEFDRATVGFMKLTPPTHTVQEFMRAFARARRAWCNATGEPLV